MKKRWYFIFAAVLMCICLAYSIAVGGRYVMDVDIQGWSDQADQLLKLPTLQIALTPDKH